MIDLSKIDLSRLTLPEWSGRGSVGCVLRGDSLSLECGWTPFASFDGLVWFYSPATWSRLVVAKTYTDRVDAFIAEETARLEKDAEKPTPRPCTREFALANPAESEFRYWSSYEDCGSARGEWSKWRAVSGDSLANYQRNEFRTTARERTAIPGLEVTASDPPPLVVGLGVQLRKGCVALAGECVGVDADGCVRRVPGGDPIGGLVIRL